MLSFKQKLIEYKPEDLVLVMHKGALVVFKLTKVDTIKQTAEAEPYRGVLRKKALEGAGAMHNKFNIPKSAILRKATQEEITKAERENKTR